MDDILLLYSVDDIGERIPKSAPLLDLAADNAIAERCLDLLAERVDELVVAHGTSRPCRDDLGVATMDPRKYLSDVAGARRTGQTPDIFGPCCQTLVPEDPPRALGFMAL